MNIESSICELKGIGEKTGKTFEKLGVYTIRDMLLAFPRDYRKMPVCEPIVSLMNNREYAVCARVVATPVVRRTASMVITVAKVTDDSAGMELIWFRSPYIKSSLKPGNSYVFLGKALAKNGHMTMEQPTVYMKEQYDALSDSYQPIYALTKGITNHLFRKTMKQACACLDDSVEFLPQDLLKRRKLMAYDAAVRQMHFPSDLETLQRAHDRLAFNEFFLFLLQMQQLKEQKQRAVNQCKMDVQSPVLEKIKRALPYELTGAQQRSLTEILDNLKGTYSMQRLLQGDVGSGKTIVAFAAMAVAAENGYQSAIMAPTEVLARQHYENFLAWCEEFGFTYPVILLTGSMTAKEKRLAYEKIAETKSALIIGTHALIQEKVAYQSLGLVITDEQHRFGVRQREVFADKGVMPHILVMSATPIPRTLAIILYGDLDISVMDELPAKRLPIKNCVVDESYRQKAYAFIKKEVAAGHQVYIICPLVEESENMEGKNVTEYSSQLSQIFGVGITVGCLHGKMKAKEKNAVMEDFLQNKIQILVSTTVVEVGVNVPNATVMMVENADRFGLAQLHQLRGRVGRGDAQSYCIFVNTSKGKTAKKRLEILNKSNDGFEIAREDLKLRGPGDFFGIRQSGIMNFAVGDVFNDAAILSAASEESNRLSEEDPYLKSETNRRLGCILEEYRQNMENNLNI